MLEGGRIRSCAGVRATLDAHLKRSRHFRLFGVVDPLRLMQRREREGFDRLGRKCSNWNSVCTGLVGRWRAWCLSGKYAAKGLLENLRNVLTDAPLLFEEPRDSGGVQRDADGAMTCAYPPTTPPFSNTNQEFGLVFVELFLSFFGTLRGLDCVDVLRHAAALSPAFFPICPLAYRAACMRQWSIVTALKILRANPLEGGRGSLESSFPYTKNHTAGSFMGMTGRTLQQMGTS